MKRTICITIEVDPDEYLDAEDSPKGTIALVHEMLRGDADIPNIVAVYCDGESETFTDL
jgi:hypothetical protein